MWWRVGVILVLVLASAACGAHAVDWITLGGYIKSFVAAIDEPGIDVVGGGINGDWLWANNNRARLNVGAKLADNLELNASYEILIRIVDDRLFQGGAFIFFPEFTVYRFADLERRMWPDDPGEGDHVAILQNLDRFYATLSLPFADLLVGRQSIAWGSAHAVNPTDIISIFAYDEIDTEDRLGVDAMRLRVPVGALGEVDAGYVAGEDFKWSLSSLFLRGKLFMLKTDVALLAMAFRENVLVGLDVARNIGGAGAWLETAYVWADAVDGRNTLSEEMDYLRASVGVEYNFNVGNGLYTFVEYHFSGAGTGEPSDYIHNVRTNTAAYVDGTVYLLGRQYVIPGLSYQLTPLVGMSLQSLVSITDGSLLVAPHIEYSVTENLYLSLGGFAAVGSNPELMVPPTKGVVALRSEFGSYPTQYYMFLQFYY